MRTNQVAAVLGAIGCVIAILFFSFSLESASASPAPSGASPNGTGYTVVERGADYRLLQKTTAEGGNSRAHKIVELATGLNYTNAKGQLVESKEEITLLPQGGAAALQGQHQVYFPSDIYNGVLEVVTPDGQHLQSRPLGVSYDDGSNCVWIARLKHSTGLLVSSNKVLYPDAFTGVKADIVAVYRRGGFECDLVFRECPPAPHLYQLDDNASTLQLFTEFFNTADPQQIPSQEDPGYGVADSNLKFGRMTMKRGKAFLVGQQATNAVAVFKSWFHADDRTFLVEQVPLNYLADDLAVLPASTNILTSQVARDHILYVAMAKRQFPPAREIIKDTNQLLVAAMDLNQEPGVVLDYVEVIGSVGDYVFKSDTTYFISAPLYCSGTVTFEEGTVLKYNFDSYVEVEGRTIFPATFDRPAIFTAADDDSVGDSLNGIWDDYVGYIHGYYANPALQFPYENYEAKDIRNVRISHAQIGVSSPAEVYYGQLPTISHSQIIDCGTAVQITGFSDLQVALNNCLIANVGVVVETDDDDGSYDYTTLNHCTVDYCNSVIRNPTAAPYAYLMATNSLFSNVGAWVVSCPGCLVALSANNGFFNTPGPFGDNSISTVNSPFLNDGNSTHYLAGVSPFRDSGVESIDPDLLAELKTRTTYAPIVLSDAEITNDIAFSPQVACDTDTPDLGYHYQRIDYALGGVSIKGATVAIYPGTVVALFGTSNSAFGLNLRNGALFICKGLATNWNHIITLNTVQEPGSSNWYPPINGMVSDVYGNGSQNSHSTLDCRFTKWSVLSQTPHIVVSNRTAVALRDCEFCSGSLFLDYHDPTLSLGLPNSQQMLASDPSIKNCLFKSVYVVVNVSDDSPTLIHNNLFRFGTFDFSPVSADAVVQNNLFDQTIIPDNSSTSGPYTNGYNAFLTNYNRLQPTSTYDLILTNALTYESGPLGKYYQPDDSPLINAGSTNANLLDLYDYTVLTDLVSSHEIKETNSVVDIGYHYVAVDSEGNPITTYTNGLPDYLVTSSTDTIPDWWEFSYFGNLALATGWDYDLDGTNILTEFQNSVDPNKIIFSFSLDNQYVSTNVVVGVITVLGGVPASIAVLVDSTNLAAATWTAYTSSSVAINLGTNQGLHDVWVGLRGRLTISQQTWTETSVIWYSATPTISITNPLNNVSFNVARVNVSGNFTAANLKEINVNGILAFTSGTNFEAVNVSLEPGTNIITAVVEDFTGATNISSINLIITTNLDGSLNSPVQLSAAPIAGVAPLGVTFQVQTNFPGTLQQVLYDWNGDGIVDFATNNLSSIIYTYATNGEYFPFVTIQTTSGKFSSIGGWNAAILDPTNEPIRINVLAAFTEVSTISITDPVDIKWVAPSNLYVLSGSTATLTQFTNGVSFRTLSGIGTAPSGFDVDAMGNVYVAVTASNQVWKVFPTNNTFAADTNFGVSGRIGLTNGLSGSNTNELNAPYDVAVSPDGTVISISDSGNHRIQQFSAINGAFINIFGTNGNAVGEFITPKGLSYDSIGTLYIADSGNHRIVTANGFTLSATGTNGAALGQFNGLANLNASERGIYVADTGNNRIQKFDAPVHGTFDITPSTTRYEFTTNFNQPKAVAMMNDFLEEKFWVADTGNDRVVLYKLAADDPSLVWASMTNRIAVGDISGASGYFSVVAAEKYHEAFLSLGVGNTATAIREIGTLTPAVVHDDTAQYYFEKTIDGEVITFPVEFVKENGVWRILEF